ncbi:MAG: flavin reductase family protein [Firmicutes bacterium]|nr:flavin reductase family protein [Bacillota bacterium]
MAKKIQLKPGTLLSPLPVALVSCASGEEKNLITIGWTGIINSEPPMTYVSVRKSRHSHRLIEESGCFVINVTTEEIVRAVDWCGVKSGRDFDKFRECGLTALPASCVEAPLVAESPINLECRVVETREYPSHDMFVAEIVAVHCDEDLMDVDGRIRLDKAGLVSYNHGEYFGLKKQALGRFGFSVMKPSTARRINREKQQKREQKNARKRGQAMQAGTARRPAARPARRRDQRPDGRVGSGGAT